MKKSCTNFDTFIKDSLFFFECLYRDEPGLGAELLVFSRIRNPEDAYLQDKFQFVEAAMKH